MLSIEMQRSTRKNFHCILVSHNTRLLQFNGKATVRLEKVSADKDNLENTNLFDCFNEYVDNVMDIDTQLELFKLYEKAHNITESSLEPVYDKEIKLLIPIIDDILTTLNVHKFTGFIHNSKFLKIPVDLAVAASKGDYPAETTITELDYVAMVKFSLVTRCVYPIIYSALNRYIPKMGAAHAELVCGQLIQNNELITRSHGWAKLVGYIQHVFSKKPIPFQIDDVASHEYFADQVIFSTIFNRLCCAVIPETEDGKNLAHAINAEVLQYTTSSKIRAKDIPSDSDEDKRSMLERHNITEDVKATNIEEQAEYFRFGLYDEKDQPRHKDRFKYQCQGLGIKNDKLVEMVFDKIPKNWEFEMKDHIVKLLGEVFAGDVSPMIVDALNFEQLKCAIALGQVKLAEQGFIYLPTVLGSIPDPDGIRSLSSLLDLSSDDTNFLVSICDIQTRNNEGRSFNEAVVAATDFTQKYGNGIWRSNLEYGGLLDDTTYAKVPEGSLFPVDINPKIKNEFIELIRRNNQ